MLPVKHGAEDVGIPAQVAGRREQDEAFDAAVEDLEGKANDAHERGCRSDGLESGRHVPKLKMWLLKGDGRRKNSGVGIGWRS